MHLPFTTDAFDVVAVESLHHVFTAGDRRKALQELCRVLKPGGRLIVLAFRHKAKYQRILEKLNMCDFSCSKGTHRMF